MLSDAVMFSVFAMLCVVAIVALVVGGAVVFAANRRAVRFMAGEPRMGGGAGEPAE